MQRNGLLPKNIFLRSLEGRHDKMNITIGAIQMSYSCITQIIIIETKYHYPETLNT